MLIGIGIILVAVMIFFIYELKNAQELPPDDPKF